MPPPVLIAAFTLVCSGCLAAPEREPIVSQATMTTTPGNPACRDYTLQAIVEGKPQTIVGHACQQPDGTWRIVEGPPGQPVTVYVPPPYPYYPYYYDPWLWGPPIGFSVGAFAFVDRHQHVHDFRRFHRSHDFAAGGFHHQGMGHGLWTFGSGGRHG